MITAYRLSTGPDGHSHVTHGKIDAGESFAAESIDFEETAAHSSFDWHRAPTTQYVITLSGKLEFATQGGETFTLNPGEILIALDTTGTGHKWRLIDDQPWKRAYVRFDSNAKFSFRPDDAE